MDNGYQSFTFDHDHFPKILNYFSLTQPNPQHLWLDWVGVGADKNNHCIVYEILHTGLTKPFGKN